MPPNWWLAFGKSRTPFFSNSKKGTLKKKKKTHPCPTCWFRHHGDFLVWGLLVGVFLFVLASAFSGASTSPI